MFFFGRRSLLSLDVFKVQTPGGREYDLFWWLAGTALLLFILGLFLGWRMDLLNVLLSRLAILGAAPTFATPLLFCLLATSMSCHCEEPAAAADRPRDDKIVLSWQGLPPNP